MVLRKWIILLCILIVLLTLQSRSLTHHLNNYLKETAYQQIDPVISFILRRSLISQMKMEPVPVRMDDQGILYDTRLLNLQVQQYLETAQKSLDAAMKGESDPVEKKVLYPDGVLSSFPLGRLSGISYIWQWGPDIPLKADLVQDLDVRILTHLEPYGINNTLFKIELQISVKTRLISPVMLPEHHHVVTVPYLIQLIQGDIPHYQTRSAQ